MSKKIFELAKELEMGPLDLVEGLKAKGYNVRNHMSTLTDEEVVKVLAEYQAAAEPEKKTKKKVTKKKKVAKKKVAKKVTKKASASAEGSEEAVGDEAPKKTTVRKKKTVIRKKTTAKSKGEDVEAPVAQDEIPVEAKPEVSVEETVQTETVSEAKADDVGGLRVVSRPEAAVKEAKETEASSDEKSKEYLEEKVHRFTPVYIPPAEQKAQSEKSASGTEQGKTEASSEEADKKDKDDSSKKRIGGLASMISPKKNQTRSQMLNEQRADNELKSYAALSGSGRPLYTQVKKKRVFTGVGSKTEITEVKDSKRIVKLHGGALVEQLAKKLSVKLKDMIDQCLDLNLLIKNGDYVGIALATEIAALYSYRVEDVAFNEDEVIGKKVLSDEEKEKLPLRNPIITIMGHVDHGKTTLLDYIRQAKVAAGEAGGITQHIGAYSVAVNEQTLTFLDTPGHAAFAAMRQRGADVTDIVVLVVAADDGVMPQTKESIRFCQNSGKTLIVAVNKMDKEGVNPDRVKQELTEFNITPEEWGGETHFVPISALKGDGVDNLLETIALHAEMLELRANPKGKAEGVVIESKIEQGRGPVATILIQSGTLKKGESIVVGESFGRARTLVDSTGKQINSAGPSTPVQILGLDVAPSPGDILNVVKNEREGKKIVQNRVDDRKKLASAPKATQKVSLEDFFASAVDSVDETKSLNLIIRADVQGSYEAIKSSLESLSNSEVEVRIIGGGVGPITDNDVNFAESANAFILGFNMRPQTSARRIAEQKGVDVKTYSIIYELINDIKLAMEGLLDPDFIEEFIGRAEVKDTFSVPKIGVIAGSVVVDGKIMVGCNVRLLRQGKILFDGKMSSLKRFKDDVKEVKNGFECGVGLENYNDVKVGDLFEAYLMIEKKRTLEDVQKASGEEAAPIL